MVPGAPAEVAVPCSLPTASIATSANPSRKDAPGPQSSGTAGKCQAIPRASPVAFPDHRAGPPQCGKPGVGGRGSSVNFRGFLPVTGLRWHRKAIRRPGAQAGTTGLPERVGRPAVEAASGPSPALHRRRPAAPPSASGAPACLPSRGRRRRASRKRISTSACPSGVWTST